LLIFPIALSAQLNRDQFPLNREFKNGFFYIAPGITYTLPYADYSTVLREDLNIAGFDTTVTYYVLPKAGNISYAFELGWYHSFENPRFFHYMDFGLAYRKFSGNSEFELLKEWDTGSSNQKAESSFELDQITGVIRIIRSQQLGKFTFFTFGPGLNFDYRINDNRNETPFFTYNQERDLWEIFNLQLHLQLGVGFRLTERLIFQPQLELPLLEILPAELHPVTRYEYGEHYPFLLSFRFMFLRKDLMNCNAPTFN